MEQSYQKSNSKPNNRKWDNDHQISFRTKISGSLQNPQIKTTSTNKAPIAHINDTSDIVRIEKLFKDLLF